eukprot:scaffold199877_cov14-Prasinocladus_malaysianus.AAC.1
MTLTLNNSVIPIDDTSMLLSVSLRQLRPCFGQTVLVLRQSNIYKPEKSTSQSCKHSITAASSAPGSH